MTGSGTRINDYFRPERVNGIEHAYRVLTYDFHRYVFNTDLHIIKTKDQITDFLPEINDKYICFVCALYFLYI